ncbi:hypothetical protein [Methylacidiphilum caldifontis]|uniref:Uncharacterized protein n=1 Tax=Methylacidiphilum caldifontis TaxID=2795386 RepID=A0A4Y8PHI1_9BACT|nr:hypothetical protein [Methylacidiphilum caldifontis]QSR88222.1 hypothetical protein IT6_07470 [Methylacidiphilum caldifontis]TFE72523.1 hypothetical protein A7Q10_03695 [Methylacidiphilum caldifontis]
MLFSSLLKYFFLCLLLCFFVYSSVCFGEQEIESKNGQENYVPDKHIKIIKVLEILNDKKLKAGGLQSLIFERAYWNWGAITPSDFRARAGQIYIFAWKKGGKAEALTARFEYRQLNTKEQTWSQSIYYPKAHGAIDSIFKVIGDVYFTNGTVFAWRFSVLRNNTIVAQTKSFIW